MAYYDNAHIPPTKYVTGLSHDQRRCIAQVVLRQGYQSLISDGVDLSHWPSDIIPLPPKDLLIPALNSWHSQIIHLASRSQELVDA